MIGDMDVDKRGKDWWGAQNAHLHVVEIQLSISPYCRFTRSAAFVTNSCQR
jgi:hypothetical protein